MVNGELLGMAGRADATGTNEIRMTLRRQDMGMKMKYCRKIYATWMREHGVAQETIDLYQGRLGKSIFLRNYFRPDAAKERNRIRRMLPKLLNELS